MQNFFVKAYEFNKIYNVDRLKIKIEKAEDAYKTHQPETIDYCKCIIESICKRIFEDRNEKLESNPDFHKLVGDTLELLGLEKGQISGGLKSIAQGICEIRNCKGIAGHGQTDKSPLPTNIEIDIFVATCSHIIKIILSLLDKQPIDILKTTLDFKILEEKLKIEYQNQYVDKNAKVEYDEKEGIIFIGGKELRPSEILYEFDRVTYNELIQEGLSELDVDNIKDILEDVILEKISDEGWLAPDSDLCHIEDISVSISDFNRDDILIIVKGTVNWTEKPIDSSEDDSIAYATIWFNAKLTYDYDKSSNYFYFDLEEFEHESANT